jgi:hypothetical protein
MIPTDVLVRENMRGEGGGEDFLRYFNGTQPVF